MSEPLRTNSSMEVTVDAAHRNGKGELIAISVSIQSAKPPQSATIKCLSKFIRDSILVALLMKYHELRVKYAESHRPDRGYNIPEKYRTGVPAPSTIWQAIYENIKLMIRR